MRTRFPLTPQDILNALTAAEGDLPAAAKALDISERTLYRRMAEFGIRRELRLVRQTIEDIVA